MRTKPIKRVLEHGAGALPALGALPLAVSGEWLAASLVALAGVIVPVVASDIERANGIASWLRGFVALADAWQRHLSRRCEKRERRRGVRLVARQERRRIRYEGRRARRSVGS